MMRPVPSLNLHWFTTRSNQPPNSLIGVPLSVQAEKPREDLVIG